MNKIKNRKRRRNEKKLSLLSAILTVVVPCRVLLLWQPLDQCSIAALQVNLLGGYLVGNTSCVIHKRTQQGTTTVFY